MSVTCDYCNQTIQPAKTRYYTGGTKDIVKDTIAMPFICRRCGGSFCADHRLPEQHDCISLTSIVIISDEYSEINCNKLNNLMIIPKPIEPCIQDIEERNDDCFGTYEERHEECSHCYEKEKCSKISIVNASKKKKWTGEYYIMKIIRVLKRMFCMHKWIKVGGPQRAGTGKFRQMYKCMKCDKHKSIVD